MRRSILVFKSSKNLRAVEIVKNTEKVESRQDDDSV